LHLCAGSLLAILLTNVVYWLGLNIFQALVMLAVLAPVAIFSGHRALKAIHTRNLLEKPKEAGST
jgi:hypothetical protein